MASLRHILMGRNGDYFLNYIDYSKNFDDVLKLLLALKLLLKTLYFGILLKFLPM